MTMTIVNTTTHDTLAIMENAAAGMLTACGQRKQKVVRWIIQIALTC